METSRQASDSGSVIRIRGGHERIRVGLGILLGVAVVVLLGVELSGSSSRSPGNEATGAVVLSEGELVGRASSIDPRPYWVGPVPGIDRFELERDASNAVSIRYLTQGGDLDGPEPLRVSTYPVPGARRSLERASRSSGEALSDGPGQVVLAPPTGSSAYVVFDDQPDLQVEVFSPRPGEAARLVAEGSLIPLGWGPIE